MKQLGKLFYQIQDELDKSFLLELLSNENDRTYHNGDACWYLVQSSSGAETPNHFLVYLYDENGAPVGLQYRNKSDAKNVFYTYYFEKNLQGDIIAIYTENGTKIGSYTYDAWGNCTVSTESGTTTIQKRIVRTLNPFRYRGYYYDTDTGLYYLQSRYREGAEEAGWRYYWDVIRPPMIVC